MPDQLEMHPVNPQARLIRQAVEAIKQGAVFAYPTDSSYALGCHLGDSDALERIRHIRQLDKQHNFTLMCRDLSEIATYAKVDNQAYRLLKAHTPGAYTFVLEATREVPKRLMHPKRKTIGIRVPTNLIVQNLLKELNEPILSLTFHLPGSDLPVAQIGDIPDSILNQLDLIIDGGFCGIEPTSVIDLTTLPPIILRRGRGDMSEFEEVN